MMTEQQSKQSKLIVTTIEALMPQEHFLRKLDAAMDFTFVYDVMRPLYSDCGRPSIDPVILVKMLLIGYLYGIDSERKLMEEIRFNIAYRWFVGLDLEDKVPDHSVFSQNRRRRFRNADVFREIFDTVVMKCAEAGLVRGKSIVMDSTHIKACAYNRNAEWVEVIQGPNEYWQSLAEEYPKQGDAGEFDGMRATVKSKCPDDPDAGYMNRTAKPKGFHYLAHQSSDADSGVILDVAVTGGDIQDCECCVERIAHLKRNMGLPVLNVGLDAGYDTIPTHHGLRELGVTGYIAPCERGKPKQGRDDMMPPEDFKFDIENDRYICPAGCYLTFRGIFHRLGEPRKMYFSHSKDCKACSLKERCFKGKHQYRRITRHIHQSDREEGLRRIGTTMCKHVLRRRKIVCEGNFALQKRCHNLRFTRKRGLVRVTEDCLFSAMALNLKRLVKYGAPVLPPAVAAAVEPIAKRIARVQTMLIVCFQRLLVPMRLRWV